MGTFFLNFLIKYFTFIPKFFLLNKNKFTKSEIIFDTIQYKSDYNTDNFLRIYLPLLLNISQISKDIKNIVSNKNLISITSTIIFYEKESSNEYTHSLSDSNQLYSLESFNKWPSTIFLNIIKKLEVYNSFKKISIIIQVKVITNI